MKRKKSLQKKSRKKKDTSENSKKKEDVAVEALKEFMKEFAKNYSKPFAYRHNLEEELNMEFERGKAISYGRFRVQLPVMIILLFIAALLTLVGNKILSNSREVLHKLNLIQKDIKACLNEYEKLIAEISLARLEDEISSEEKLRDIGINMENIIFQRIRNEIITATNLATIIDAVKKDRWIFSKIDMNVRLKIFDLKKEIENIKPKLEVLELISKSVIRCKMGYNDEALKLIEAAISKDIKNSNAIGYKGYILLQTGKLEAAEKYLKEAYKICSSDQYILTNLGSVFEKQGKQNEAIKFYEKAINANPYFPIPYCKYADLLYKQNNNGPEKAIAMYKKALFVSPNYISALSKCNDILIKNRRYDEALELAQKAVNVQPDNVNSLLALANVYYQLNSLDYVKKILNKISKISPSHKDAINLAEKVKSKEEELLHNKASLDVLKQNTQSTINPLFKNINIIILGYNRYNVFCPKIKKLNTSTETNHKQISEETNNEIKVEHPGLHTAL